VLKFRSNIPASTEACDQELEKRWHNMQAISPVVVSVCAVLLVTTLVLTGVLPAELVVAESVLDVLLAPAVVWDTVVPGTVVVVAAYNEDMRVLSR